MANAVHTTWEYLRVLFVYLPYYGGRDFVIACLLFILRNNLNVGVCAHAWRFIDYEHRVDYVKLELQLLPVYLLSVVGLPL